MRAVLHAENSELDPAKAVFVSNLYGRLRTIPEVKSITFAGSFVEKPGLDGISDIDVIVVVDRLTFAIFTACREATASISPSTLGLPDHCLRINDTFGPLKFDEPGVIVVHLMIYDKASHREHVLKSPFTCFDWERSPIQTGSPLRALYPVLPLQPRQFVEARRSLTNYLRDIATGTISYRSLHFDGSSRQEILNRLPLDERHQGEYAFHIVRNLLANYVKLLRKDNRQLPENELLEFWRSHLPGCSHLINWFVGLSAMKRARRNDFPSNTVDNTREFLTLFAEELSQTWSKRAVRHVFIRHARTALNDGSFLGQRRDPTINEIPLPLDSAPSIVFASPARRCRESAASLAPGSSVRSDARLLEIDYGAAEGMDFSQLEKIYPEVPLGWARGEDPVFPGGENTAAVATRLKSFFADLPMESSLVVTHNVVLRCIVGGELGIPAHCWHHIPVAHLEEFEILRLDRVNYLNLTQSQVEKISDALAGHLA